MVQEIYLPSRQHGVEKARHSLEDAGIQILGYVEKPDGTLILVVLHAHLSRALAILRDSGLMTVLKCA